MAVINAYVGNTLRVHINWQSTATTSHTFYVAAAIGTRGAGSPYSTPADEFTNFSMHKYGGIYTSVAPGSTHTTTIDISLTATDVGTWDVAGVIAEPPSPSGWDNITTVYDMKYAEDQVSVSHYINAQINSVTFEIV